MCEIVKKFQLILLQERTISIVEFSTVIFIVETRLVTSFLFNNATFNYVNH